MDDLVSICLGCSQVDKKEVDEEKRQYIASALTAISTVIVSTNAQLLYWSCEYYEILNTYHP